MKDNIAKIVVDSKSGQVVDMTFDTQRFRFRCKRCAIFCCKLGSPNLHAEDIRRIGKAGCVKDGLLKPSIEEGSRTHAAKTESGFEREDGSCIFLRFSEKLHVYECSIYHLRPALCRVYPFTLERINSHCFMLKVIPCCNGLNNSDGEIVNEQFITNHLLGSLLQIARASPK